MDYFFAKSFRYFSTSLLILLFVLIPLLAMGNCEGFNEGSMKAQSCIIDSELLKSIASFYFGWLLMSAFLLGAPIFIYGGILYYLIKKVIWKKKTATETSNPRAENR